MDLPPVDPPVVPVTTQCVIEAAQRTGVPFAVLATVLAMEAGQVGQARRNRDGSFDYGPMQINTRRAEDLAQHYPLDWRRLRWDGCYNVAVGGFVLAQEARRSTRTSARERMAEAIGNYHSRTARYHLKYLRKAAQRASWIRRPGAWQSLLRQINSRIGRRGR